MKKTIEDGSSKKSVQKEVEKLKRIVENNKKNKEKWKTVIYDITKKLEVKITDLLQENYELKRSMNKSEKF